MIILKERWHCWLLAGTIFFFTSQALPMPSCSWRASWGLLLLQLCTAKVILGDGDAVPYLVRCVGVLCPVLNVPPGQRQGGLELVPVVGDLLPHVAIVGVDDLAGDVSEGDQ